MSGHTYPLSGSQFGPEIVARPDPPREEFGYDILYEPRLQRLIAERFRL
jgi:hypothetical protein